MNKNHGHKSHGFWMILCCLIPVILMGILFSSDIQESTTKSVLGVLLILACPLGHILMMMFMGKKQNHQNGEKEEEKKSCH